jgi:hypothetical protein
MMTLRDTTPPVWRRVLVPGAMTLDALHDVIQTAMGWENDHLHEFVLAKRTPVEDEERVTVSDLVAARVKKFVYTYDFGDSWRHDLTIGKIEPREPGRQYPVCVGGERNCPPEDCGGIWGYEELLEMLADRKHPGRRERADWLRGFDPEAFDIDKVNAGLAAQG